MKNLSLILLLCPAISFAQSFSRQVQVDSRVVTELRKFSAGGTSLPESYASSFPQVMLRRILSEKQRFLTGVSSGKACVPSTTVTYMNAGELIGSRGQGAADADAIDEFESGMIKIESVGCLSGNVAARAAALVSQPAFQLKVVGELKSSRIQGNLTCDHTSVTGLGDSRYCFTSISQNSASESHLFTQNVSNAPVAQASAPVFYRSIYMTFTEKANVTHSHTIAYVRGPKIPGLLKGIGRSRIISTQTKGFIELQRELR
jgi:hypothetical protein